MKGAGTRLDRPSEPGASGLICKDLPVCNLLLVSKTPLWSTPAKNCRLPRKMPGQGCFGAPFHKHNFLTAKNLGSDRRHHQRARHRTCMIRFKVVFPVCKIT